MNITEMLELLFIGVDLVVMIFLLIQAVRYDFMGTKESDSNLLHIAINYLFGLMMVSMISMIVWDKINLVRLLQKF